MTLKLDDLLAGFAFAVVLPSTLSLFAGELRGRPRHVLTYIDLLFAELEVRDLLAAALGPGVLLSPPRSAPGRGASCSNRTDSKERNADLEQHDRHQA